MMDQALKGVVSKMDIMIEDLYNPYELHWQHSKEKAHFKDVWVLALVITLLSPKQLSSAEVNNAFLSR